MRKTNLELLKSHVYAIVYTQFRRHLALRISCLKCDDPRKTLWKNFSKLISIVFNIVNLVVDWLLRISNWDATAQDRHAGRTCSYSVYLILYGAVCCMVLQCVAVLHCVALCCSVLQCGRTWSYSVYLISYGAAVWCSVLQCVAVCCSVVELDLIQYTSYRI